MIFKLKRTRLKSFQKDDIETWEKNSDIEQSAVPSSEDNEQDFL